MSELIGSESGSEGAPSGPGIANSAGALLREARMQRGLHVAAVAAMLKVPQAKLEALEADRWDDLTDMTFVRALAKAVCRTLKMDAAPVLALLPRGGERELDVSKGINTPFRERGGRDDALSVALLRRPLVWGPLLVLLGAAAVYLLPNNWMSRPAPAEAAGATGAAAAPAGDSAASAALGAPEPASSVEVASVPVQPPAPAASQPAPAPVAASKPAAPAPSPASAEPVAAGSVPVKIHVKADSWVSVVDARGQVLISRLLHTGEDQDLAGQPPLKVTVGNVAGTELSLRGSPVDLESQAKDNVARIELN